MDDLSLDDCDKCFSKISSRLIGCFPFTAGRVFLDGCFMRFDNYSFYEEIASEIYDVQRCSDTDAAANSKEYAFSAMVLIDNLVEKGTYEQRLCKRGDKNEWHISLWYG
ncbi:Cysteine-rich receptor-like protein kinase 42 [Camellia lanceoleosa]|uniref:Cysteine-rich receptor-like protein kinase 42 n=1 Tax=Camellia lanceoleosa TaxID=1840588 RepID=A0ACC0H266_9ERIC|nr:Cysteine-rich receptor-like protein kinase 42 [Camellia lanceoleosa]